MAEAERKGSIILEILIVILFLALIGTIMYPKNVWEKEERNTKICRTNMDKILKAELIYLKYHNTYEDTLDNVISFIDNDTTSTLIMEYVYSDTALAENILKKLTEIDSIADNKIKTYLADTLLLTILETTKYDSNFAKVILNRLENTAMQDSIIDMRKTDSSDVWILKEISKMYPVLDIVTPLQQDDSLKLVFERIKPEISVGALIDTLYKNNLWANRIDNIVKHSFETFKFCPTNNKPYKITVDDTSVIKLVNIYCPIDSLEIENAKKDFIAYHLGHLRLENHGNIKGGEKSWLSQ